MRPVEALQWRLVDGARLYGGVLVGGSPLRRQRLAADLVAQFKAEDRTAVFVGDRDGNFGTEAGYYDEIDHLLQLHDALTSRIIDGRGNHCGYAPVIWNQVVVCEHAQRLLDGSEAAEPMRQLIRHGAEHAMAVVALLDTLPEGDADLQRLAQYNTIYLDTAPAV